MFRVNFTSFVSGEDRFRVTDRQGKGKRPNTPLPVNELSLQFKEFQRDNRGRGPDSRIFCYFFRNPLLLLKISLLPSFFPEIFHP